jgi:hypothetical protein
MQFGVLTELLDSDQVLATTVFDRDRADIAQAAVEPEVPSACRPHEEFALGHWGDARPAYQQIVELAGRLVGEFDTPDPEVLLALAQLYIRFGLGTEAEQILAAFPVDLDSRALLVDLARTVEGREPLPGGPLSLTDRTCAARSWRRATARTAKHAGRRSSRTTTSPRSASSTLRTQRTTRSPRRHPSVRVARRRLRDRRCLRSRASPAWPSCSSPAATAARARRTGRPPPWGG